MDFFDLVNISERYMELVNPSTPEKMLKLGRILDLAKGKRVIDLGCGYGEVLALWSEHLGISGTGVEVRETACKRARVKMVDRGLEDLVEIVCANAADFAFETEGYDAAVCLGASFIWGGFSETIRVISRAIQDEGKLAIGEPYWRKEPVPPEYAATEPSVQSEINLLEAAHEEGFDIEYVIRASFDDWDRYEADNWYALIRWIEEHPEHPEREEVINHLHQIQETYFSYGREYLGWAVYVLSLARY